MLALVPSLSLSCAYLQEAALVSSSAAGAAAGPLAGLAWAEAVLSSPADTLARSSQLQPPGPEVPLVPVAQPPELTFEACGVTTQPQSSVERSDDAELARQPEAASGAAAPQTDPSSDAVVAQPPTRPHPEGASSSTPDDAVQPEQASVPGPRRGHARRAC